MKITKQVLAEMRHYVAEPQGFSAQRGDLAELPVGLLQALLDERKALRAALDQACGEITNWRHKEAVAALALGEDEE